MVRRIASVFRLRTARLAAAVTLAGLFPAGAAPAEDAVASVRRIFTSTVEAAASPDILATRLAPSIDLEALSQKVLGMAYGAAPASDRADFDAVLLQVIALELSERIRKARTFEIFGTRDLRGADVVVFSRLTNTDGIEKRIDWKMRPCGSSFCIYDLLSDNASFSASRRDEYAARLQAAGGSLARLTDILRAQVAARH